MGCKLVDNTICTDKESMVQTHYCSEWTKLWYGRASRVDSSYSRTIEPESSEFIIPFRYLLFIIYWLLKFVNQIQVGADLRYLLL